MSNLRTATFSFLTTGPGFSFDVPEDFDLLPELSSPLLNGRGGRSFDFASTARDPGQPDNTMQIDTMRDRYGRPVELYWRLETPPLWWLRWHLTSGYLYSHLREEDGEEMAAITIESLDVVETRWGAPFLLPSEPLEIGVSTAPTFQEQATFLSTTRGPSWSVTLQRPGFTREGSVLVAPPEYMGDRVLLRAGLGDDVEVWVWGENDHDSAAAITEGIKDSFRLA
ncbi:MAG: hypothetical protein WD556_00650 [Actinomycetota bacterium]